MKNFKFLGIYPNLFGASKWPESKTRISYFVRGNPGHISAETVKGKWRPVKIMAESELNLFYSKVWTISQLKKFQGLVFMSPVVPIASRYRVFLVRQKAMIKFEPVIRDEKPNIISLSETLLKAKLFYKKEFLNVKKWKRFPELNRLLGGFR